MSEKVFRPWVVDQHQMFPPSPMDLVPGDHLVHFIRDLVREELDLGAIFAAYEVRRGYPPYHPGLMTALLLYAYSRGIDSSRRIEGACEERGVNAYIATGRQKHGRASPTSNERARQGPRSKAMRAKLRRGGWRSRLAEHRPVTPTGC